MLDLSRAQNIKNYKSSFGKTADKIIAEINDLKSSFDTDTASLNDVRKERNEIIDKASKILQKNGIKLSKPLGKYDNFDLCMILCNAAADLEGADKETLEICSIQIDNRYHDIINKSLSLETMMNRLSNMSVLEEDSQEEVVLDLKAIRKKKGLDVEPEQVTITEDSNPIISNEEPVIPALETFNESLEDNGKFETITPDVEPEEIVSEIPKEPELDTIETEPELVEEELPINSDASETEEIAEEIVPIEETTEEKESTPEAVEEIATDEVDNFVANVEEPTFEEEPEVNQIDEAIQDELEEEKKYQTMSIKPVDDTLINESVMSDIIDETIDEETEQVVGIKQASPELLANVNAMLEERAIKDYTHPDSSFIGVEDDIIGDDDLFTYDNDISSGLSRDLVDFVDTDDDVDFVQKEDESNIIDYLNYVDSMNNDEVSFENQDEDSMPFTLDDKLTLDEIANNVYGDADLWKDLYKYGSNKSKIDKRAREAHVSVSVAATNPGYLAGLELNFPVELITYEEVPEDNYSSQYSYSSGRGRRGRAA